MLTFSNTPRDMRSFIRSISIAAVAGLMASPAVLSAQIWTNWTTPGVNSLTGNLGGTTVTVTGIDGYQLSDGTTRTGGVTSSPGCGFAFFCTALPYTSPGVSAPTNNGFFQYVSAHTTTITFSSAVTNPYLAFISVGQGGLPVTYDFGTLSPVFLSNNTGAGNEAAWGGGSVGMGAHSFIGSEYSGTIEFIGTFNSITFTEGGDENWHGVTVGTASVVPEPSTYALMGAGLLAVGVASRRRRKLSA